MINDKAAGLIGLARRAGKLSSGGFTVEKQIKAGRAALVLMDETASENTKKALGRLCENRGVPLKFLPEGELSRVLNDFRISAAILDVGFAARILEYLA